MYFTKRLQQFALCIIGAFAPDLGLAQSDNVQGIACEFHEECLMDQCRDIAPLPLRLRTFQSSGQMRTLVLAHPGLIDGPIRSDMEHYFGNLRGTALSPAVFQTAIGPIPDEVDKAIVFSLPDFQAPVRSQHIAIFENGMPARAYIEIKKQRSLSMTTDRYIGRCTLERF